MVSVHIKGLVMYRKMSDKQYEILTYGTGVRIVEDKNKTICEMACRHDALLYVELLQEYNELMDRYDRACDG